MVREQFNILIKITPLIILANVSFASISILSGGNFIPSVFNNIWGAGILTNALILLITIDFRYKFCKWFKIVCVFNLINSILCLLDDVITYELPECLLIIRIMLALCATSILVCTIGYFKYGFCRIDKKMK